ncbi:DsbA family oxidoreductase [Geobacillus genomosp. 3]|nr:DsbA family protein [Geobacillus genomosp. 3]
MTRNKLGISTFSFMFNNGRDLIINLVKKERKKNSKMVILPVDFFHDVLCAWCYALSPRLRRLVDELKNKGIVLEVRHHCFALAPTSDDLVRMFGSKEWAKKEILSHWRAANVNSDEKCIRADLMETRTHDYPFSMPGLIACQAAAKQRGEEAHWDYFDRLQYTHLTECLDITQEEVLIYCAKEIGLDTERFVQNLHDEQTKKAVEADIALAREWGIGAVPALIIAQKWHVSGAQKTERLREIFHHVARERNEQRE